MTAKPFIDSISYLQSLVGGLSIVAGYFATARQARLRQQLVLGLGVCDAIQAIDIV